MNSLKQKQIDFKQRALTDPDQSVKARRAVLLALPFAAAALTIGALEARMLVPLYTEVNPEIDRIDAYLADKTVKSDYDEAVGLRSRRDMLTILVDNLQGARDAIESYPELEAVIYDDAAALAGTRITIRMLVYDRTTGLLTLSCTAPDMADVPVFIAGLRETGRFENDVVDYDGEHGGNRDKETSAYAFTVYATVAKEAV